MYRNQHILSHSSGKLFCIYPWLTLILFMQQDCIFRLFYFTTHHSDIYLVCKVNEKLPFLVNIAIKKPALRSRQGNFAHALHCAFFSYLAATGNACPFSWQSLAFCGQVSTWQQMSTDYGWKQPAQTTYYWINNLYSKNTISISYFTKNKLGTYEN